MNRMNEECMAPDMMNIKCVLGDEIRVVIVRREVTNEELFRILNHEYGHDIIVTHYEDHEGDVVTVSSYGLQSVLTEHAEFHSNGLMPTLKLFLQPRASGCPVTPSLLPPTLCTPSCSPITKLPPQQAPPPGFSTPNFPIPQSPQANPVPIPFHFPQSTRVTSPKLIEQNQHDEEKEPIRWEKGPVIGREEFGIVYMGMRDNGELLAVKQLEFDELEDPKSRAALVSFIQEINVMKNLKHENIVRYLGIQQEYQCLDIFLEYVAGESISTLLGKFMKFSEPVIKNYTKQILQGIAYLHEHHIMHRDIKGANILVDVNGMVKLADCGCSQFCAVTAHMLKHVQGTPYWMAPEVIKQSGYDYSADIWSLGCVIIEMATGQPPWQAQFPEVTAAMFHIASTESPPEFPENLSPEAHDFLSLCFRRNPKERPHAKELLKHAFLHCKEERIALEISFSFSVKHFIIGCTMSPATVVWRVGKSKLELLPVYLILNILHFLPLDLQSKMRYVCKHFAVVVYDGLWKFQRSGRIGGSSTSNTENRKVWSDVKISCVILKGHTKAVHCLALAEHFLASGGVDKKIRLWEVRRGKALISLKGHTSTVTGVCVSKSLTHVYSASSDTSVRIWAPYKNGSLSNKSSLYTLNGPNLLTSIALADAETKLVVGSVDKSICVWETGGKNALLHTLTGHDASVNSVQCDGVMIVSASSDSTLKVWDLRAPPNPIKTLTGHTGEVKCCYLANDRLVSGGEDKQVRIWDLGTGRSTMRIDHSHTVTSVAADSTKIISGGYKVVKLWEWDSDVCTRSLPFASSVLSVLCDDQRVFTAFNDKLVRILSPHTLTAPLFARLRNEVGAVHA